MSSRAAPSRVTGARSSSLATAGILQRRCACGPHAEEGGSCQCRQERPPGAAPTRSHEQTAAAAPPVAHDVLRFPGRPLDDTTRSLMEYRFGYDLSRVRVHTDAAAAAAARAVNAAAYTVGKNIVFAAGRYDPKSDEGRDLLAHEVAHVVQQRDLPWSPGTPLTIGEPGSSAERDAARASRTRSAARLSLGSVRDAVLQRAEPGSPAPAPAAKPQAREVTAIKLDCRENGGLGRFDTLLFSDCTMMVQFRMNFNYKGPWPSEKAKHDWQDRFIGTVRAGWSRQFALESDGACTSGCASVVPFVQIFAPHSSPHVVTEVTYTDTWIQSRAGSGTAVLDSLDLSEDYKGGPQKQVGALHEFGHLSGRADMYRPGSTCATGYPKEGVMCMGSTITAQDYEPFAHALGDMTGCKYKVGASQATPNPKEGHAGLGGFLGAVGGAATGAAIGSAFGPLGIGIGAMAGLAVGAGAGALIGSAV